MFLFEIEFMVVFYAISTITVFFSLFFHSSIYWNGIFCARYIWFLFPSLKYSSKVYRTLQLVGKFWFFFWSFEFFFCFWWNNKLHKFKMKNKVETETKSFFLQRVGLCIMWWSFTSNDFFIIRTKPFFAQFPGWFFFEDFFFEKNVFSHKMREIFFIPKFGYNFTIGMLYLFNDLINVKYISFKSKFNCYMVVLTEFCVLLLLNAWLSRKKRIFCKTDNRQVIIGHFICSELKKKLFTLHARAYSAVVYLFQFFLIF